MRTLVIESDEQLRKLIVEMLVHKAPPGTSIVEAENLLAADEEHLTASAVLCDSVVRFETKGQLRSWAWKLIAILSGGRGIPLVLLTGDPGTYDEARRLHRLPVFEMTAEGLRAAASEVLKLAGFRYAAALEKPAVEETDAKKRQLGSEDDEEDGGKDGKRKLQKR